MRLVVFALGLSACNMDFQVSGFTDANGAALDTASDPADATGADRRGQAEDTDVPDDPPSRRPCRGPS
jgi:hypothetical protein